jgi:hypothetical protein
VVFCDLENNCGEGSATLHPVETTREQSWALNGGVSQRCARLSWSIVFADPRIPQRRGRSHFCPQKILRQGSSFCDIVAA